MRKIQTLEGNANFLGSIVFTTASALLRGFNLFFIIMNGCSSYTKTAERIDPNSSQYTT